MIHRRFLQLRYAVMLCVLGATVARGCRPSASQALETAGSSSNPPSGTWRVRLAPPGGPAAEVEFDPLDAVPAVVRF